jgi:hypothetical protein
MRTDSHAARAPHAHLCASRDRESRKGLGKGSDPDSRPLHPPPPGSRRRSRPESSALPTLCVTPPPRSLARPSLLLLPPPPSISTPASLLTLCPPLDTVSVPSFGPRAGRARGSDLCESRAGRAARAGRLRALPTHGSRAGRADAARGGSDLCESLAGRVLNLPHCRHCASPPLALSRAPHSSSPPLPPLNLNPHPPPDTLPSSGHCALLWTLSRSLHLARARAGPAGARASRAGVPTCASPPSVARAPRATRTGHRRAGAARAAHARVARGPGRRHARALRAGGPTCASLPRVARPAHG